MIIQFLGTSAATPTKARNVSAIAVKIKNSNKWYLIDCGDGTQHRILNTNLSLQKLDGIFITHIHGDHIFGLPGLLASTSLSGRKKPLSIYCPKEIKTYIKSAFQTTQTYLTFEINFIIIENKKKLIETNDFEVEITDLSHRVPSYAFGFIEKFKKQKLNVEKLIKDQIEKGPVWGKLQGGIDVELSNGKILKSIDYLLPNPNPRKIIIAGDNDKPELLSEAVKTTDLLIHEATYTDEMTQQKGEGRKHTSAKCIADFAERSRLNNLILTHFSARYDAKDKNDLPLIKDIEIEAKQHYSGNLFLAEDYDIYELSKDKIMKLQDN